MKSEFQVLKQPPIDGSNWIGFSDCDTYGRYELRYIYELEVILPDFLKLTVASIHMPFFISLYTTCSNISSHDKA